MYFFTKTVGLKEILYSLVPISNSSYWFMTQYSLLIAISPLLNRLINGMERHHMRRMLILLTIVFSLIPTILFWSREFISDGYDLSWMILLYCFGAYIKLYALNIRGGYKYIGLCVLCTISRLILGNLALHLSGSYSGAGLLYGGNSAVLLFAAICLFSTFLRINLNSLKIRVVISSISKCSIGVYLFHNHPILRSSLWDLIQPAKYLYNLPLTLLYIFVVSLTIYIIGCVVEFIRKVLMRILQEEKLLSIIDRKYKDYLSRR